MSPGTLVFHKIPQNSTYIVFTTKKTLIVIKTIVRTRDPGHEIENEMTNLEFLNSETFFSQASHKCARFSY